MKALIASLLALLVLAFAGPAFAQDPTPVPTATPTSTVGPQPTPLPTATPPNPGVPAPNDAFAQPITLSTASPRATGSTVNATIEAGEPPHWNSYRAHSVWFDYTPDVDRTVVIHTCGSSFDTILAVYTGNAVAALTQVINNDDSSCGVPSRVSFAAKAGTRYRIALDGFSGASGAYQITLDEDGRPENDAQGAATYVSDRAHGTNVRATREPGEPAHAGVGGGHSVWYRLISPNSTASVRMTVSLCGATFDSALAIYSQSYGGLQEVASNDDNPQLCGAGSTASAVSFTAAPFTSYLIAVDGKGDAAGEFDLDLLSNDNRAGARGIGRSQLITQNNALATREAGEPLHAGDPGGHSVWFRTPVMRGGERVSINTCVSQFGGNLDTVLGVYNDSYGGLQEIAFSDDALGCGLGGKGSAVTFTAPAGSLLIAVDGKGGATGTFSLSFTAPPANDRRADAAVLTTTATQVSGDMIGATAEPGEPAHAGTAASHSVWYSLARPNAGLITLEVCSAPADTRLAVYTESYGGLQEIAGNDDTAGCGSGGRGSRLSFRADGIRTYLIAIDGNEQNFTLAITRALSNDDFAAAAQLSFSASGDTTLATAQAGEPAHAGAPARHSLWYRYDVPSYAGATLGLSTCSQSTAPVRVAVYTGTALESLTPIASATAGAGSCAGGNGVQLSWPRVNPTVNETYWIAVDTATAADTRFSLVQFTPPFNDARANASQMYTGSRSYGSTLGATREAGEPNHGGTGATASVWYRWTASSGGTTQIDTCAPSYSGAADTVVGVYTDGYGGLQEVQANDDSALCPDGKRSLLRFPASAGTEYWIAVATPHEPGYFGVRLVQRPYNDDRAQALNLSDGYQRVGGALDLATAEAGEPRHGGVGTGHSIWYRWTPAATGPVRLDTCSSYVDSVLAVYTDSYGGLQEVQANDDTPGCGPTGTGSLVRFTAFAGTSYLIAIDAKGNASDDVILTLPPRNDHFAGATAIRSDSWSQSTDLTNASAEAGEPAHAGSAAASSVWYAWTPERSALATVELCGSNGVRFGVYTGTSVAALTPVTASPSSACPGTGTRMRFEATAGTTYRIAVDSTTTGAPYFSLAARLAPANDRLADATPVTSETTTYSSTADAGREAGEPDHAGVGGQSTVWYRWTPQRSATAVVDTCSYSTFDTAIAVYAQTGTGMAGLSELDHSDNACGTAGRVRLHVDAGSAYYVAVTGRGAAEGSFGLRFTLGPANDDFANARDIGSGPSYFGTTLASGHQVGEPVHDGTGVDRSVWYRFTLGSARNIELRACPNEISAIPALAAYTGESLMTLLSAGTATTRNGCRVITLRGVTGTRYVAVDGDDGDFYLALRVAPANDDRDLAQTISGAGAVSGTNDAATAEEGESAGARSVWYRWTAPRSGPIAFDTCDATFDSLVSVQRATGEAVTVGDSACGTGGRRVSFTAEAGTAYLIKVDGRDGAEGSFTLWAPPANDLFAAAQTLSGTLDSRSGTTNRAITEPGEPAATHSVWYAWTPPRSGAVEVSTCLASSQATRVAIYTGSEPGALTAVTSSGPVAGCASGSGARIRTRLVGGTTYRIAVDAAVEGTFTLQVALAPVNDDRENATAVSGRRIVNGTTAFATAEDGEPARAGQPAAASVWYRFHADATGTVALKTCGSTFATVLGVYDSAMTQLAASASGGGRCGGRAAVSFSAQAGQDYLIALDGVAGVNGAFSLAIGAPANDDLEDAITLAGTHASGTASTEGATTQDGEPTDLFGSGVKSAWWRWTAPNSGSIELNTCGSGYRTQLSVFRASVTIANRVAQNTFGSGCGSQSRLTFTAQAGTTYLIGVSSYDGEGGSARLQIGPPDNDRFAGAQALTLSADGTVVALNTLAGAAREDSEPQHNAGGRGRSLWYAWTAPDSGLLTLDSCGSTAPLYLAAYLGTALGSLQRVAEMPPADTCADGRVVTIQVDAGRAYRFAIEGSDDSAAATTLRLRLNVDNDPPETTISTGPPALSNLANVSVEFTADEAGSTFECRLDAQPFSACTSPKSYGNVPEGDHAIEVRATDRAGNLDETAARRAFTLDRTPPDLRIDAAPAEFTNQRDATFTFASTDATATFQCRLDGAAFAACASPVTRTGLSDARHDFRVQATDPAGNETTVLHSFTVDTIAPETTLTSKPHDPTNELDPAVAFSSETGATFACSVDDAAFAACTTPLVMSGLGEGDHTVRVRATDRAGNAEATPASHLFEIDRTAPETSILEGPAAPFHEGARFRVRSTEDGEVQCQIDDDAYENCTPGQPYIVDMIGKGPGVHTFRARSRDAAGNLDPTPAEYQFTFLNAKPTTSIDVTPDGGPANLDVVATLSASDGDGDLLDYEVDWGDGAKSTGVLPHGGIPHTYTKAGLYAVRIEVSDGYESDVVTRNVTVVLPEPLVAAAGDDLVAIAGEPVTLDGGGTRPLIGVAGYRWDFGDGQSATTALATHTYTQPGTYTAKLTATAGAQSDSDETTVTVLAPDGRLGVLATVTSGGMPVPAADVLVVTPDGTRISGVTDAAGNTRLRGLPAGTFKVLAYAQHYLPGGATATVAEDGTGEVAINLAAGEVAKADVSARRMTLQEILDAGIDPNDPANQHTFTFTVNLQVKGETVSMGGIGAGGSGAGGGGGGGFLGGGSGGLVCRRLYCKGQVSGTTIFISYQELAPGVPGMTTLVIPFKARWLKEFFDVSMTVTNLADPEFVLEDGSAMLDLPAGLALAPTGRGEHLTQSLPDIPGGGNATAHWIVRGDDEGSYQFGATYGARLEPFGASVSIRGEMDEPLKVWGGSALRLVVDVDRQIRDRYPYALRVGLQNVSDIPVYNPGVELLKEGRHGYIEQPRQQRDFTAPEVAPGETFWAGPFILITEATGEIDLEKSFIKKIAGDVDLQSSIITHERVPTFEDTPTVSGHRRGDGSVVLEFARASGATGEQVFATPDRETDFPADPVPAGTPVTKRAAGKLKLKFKLDGQPELAISSVIGGRPTMVHPLISSASLPFADLQATAPSLTACAQTDVPVSFDDPDYDVTRWEYSLNDGAFVSGTVDGSGASTLVLPKGNTAIKYKIRVYNELDEMREIDGQRSICTSEWPHTEIDDSGLDCGSGTGSVVIRGVKENDGAAAITAISYIVGARAVQTASGNSLTLYYGPTDAYKLRTGGEVIRAASQDETGNIGTVAVHGICPTFADRGELPAPKDPPATGTEGGAPPKALGPADCKSPDPLGKEDSAGLDAAVNIGSVPVRLTAKCIYRWGVEKKWVLTDGAVRVGGVDFAPEGPPAEGVGKRQYPGVDHAIIITAARGDEPPKLETLGRYALKVGGLKVTSFESFETRGRRFRTELNKLVEPDLKGLNPTRNVKASIDFTKDGASLEVVFSADQLGAKFSDVTLTLRAAATFNGGLDLASVHVGVEGQVAGVINLKGALDLRKREGAFVFGGDVQATFGAAAKKLGGISTDLSFFIANGKLERASASVAKTLVPPRPLGTPLVLLNKLALDLGYDNQAQNASLSFGGRAGFTAGGFAVGDMGTLALVDGEMGLLYSLNENSSDAIRLEGQAKLLHGKVGGIDQSAGQVTGESTLRFSGFLDVQGSFELKPTFLKGTIFENDVSADGTLFGWLDTTGDKTRFALETKGNIHIPVGTVSGTGTVTTKGAGLCATVKVAIFEAELGAMLEWQNRNLTFGCGFDAIKETPSAAELFPPGGGASSASAAQAGPMKTTVPAGTRAVGYIFKGRDEMPTVTVRGPASTFDTANPPRDPGTIVLHNAVTKQVMVLLAAPKAGEYMFESPQAVATVARSFSVPDPKVKVRVKPLANGRSKLTYEISDLGQRQLRFMERGSGGSHTIGRARGARGSFTYRPEEGRAGKREIFAIYGRDDRVVKVGNYRYGGPPRTGKPGRVTVRRRGGDLTVRFGKARGAVLAYRITVRVGGRTVRRVVDPGKRQLVVGLVAAGEKATVKVVSLNAIRKASVTRSAKFVIK